jgi:hypothetical protein
VGVKQVLGKETGPEMLLNAPISALPLVHGLYMQVRCSDPHLNSEDVSAFIQFKCPSVTALIESISAKFPLYFCQFKDISGA